MKAFRILMAAIVLAMVAANATSAEDWIGRAQSKYDEKGGLALIKSIKEDKLAVSADLAIGIVYHNLARLKPEAYLKTAIDTLKPISAKIPLGLAYYGSILTIQGGFAQTNGDMVGATTATQDGIDAIDLAVSQQPQNTSIRFLRIENGLSVSKDSPFKRWAVIQTDLDYLNGLSGDALSQNAKAELMVFAGDLAMGTSKATVAIKQYQKAIKFAPESPAAAWAKARLKVLE